MRRPLSTAASSTTRATVPISCRSWGEVARSRWAKARTREPVRRAISSARRAPGVLTTVASEDSGKRHRSFRGSTGRRTLAESLVLDPVATSPPGRGCRGGILLCASAQAAAPLPAEDGAQVGPPAAGQQLEVVLADARDGQGIAAGQGDRGARHLAHECRPVAGLAGEPPRGG